MSRNLVEDITPLKPQKSVLLRDDRAYARGAILAGTANSRIPAGTIVTCANFYLVGTPKVAVGQGATAVGVLVNDAIFGPKDTEIEVSVAYFNAVVDVTKIPTAPTSDTITALNGKVLFVRGE